MANSAFIISDIHLGATASLLTAWDDEESTGTIVHRPLAGLVMDKLIADLKRMAGGRKIDECILLGDIFDLSFAPYGLTMKNGRWFFEELVKADLFKTFIYVPGNHDHHLWQQISEHYYLMTALDNPPLEYPRTLPATQLIGNTFLDDLLPKGRDLKVTYPNYAVNIGGKAFYMHHGHFLQKLYIASSRFLSEVLETNDIDDLEKLNAPFLEFGWYNMGQAYNLGNRRLLDHFYFLFKNNRTQELDKLIALGLKKINKLGRNPNEKGWHPIRQLLDFLNLQLGTFFIRRMFRKYSGKLKRDKTHMSTARHKPLTESVKQTIAAYIQQFLLEPGQSVDSCAFICGHTHEPEANSSIETLGGTKINIYNTGGWVVDQVDGDGCWLLPQAAPIYVDEDGNVHPLNFTSHHHTFLRSHIDSDPRFQRPGIITSS